MWVWAYHQYYNDNGLRDEITRHIPLQLENRDIWTTKSNNYQPNTPI
jgi:hypothetical protein